MYKFTDKTNQSRIEKKKKHLLVKPNWYIIILSTIPSEKGGGDMCAAKRLTGAERKKEIMDSAAKVIVAKGFGKTTMEDIIAGTTLSKGGV